MKRLLFYAMPVAGLFVGALFALVIFFPAATGTMRLTRPDGGFLTVQGDASVLLALQHGERISFGKSDDYLRWKTPLEMVNLRCSFASNLMAGFTFAGDGGIVFRVWAKGFDETPIEVVQ